MGRGDELETGSLPEIWARIRGTGPLKQVVVVRDNRYVYAQEPGASEFELRYGWNSATGIWPGHRRFG